MFQNLIMNAIKYQARNSRPVISITSTVNEQEKFHEIHIKDNGIGIAPEHQRNIIDIFKRLHVSEDYAGTGLGLAICKRIALSHGGDVTEDSSIDQGATFTVKLLR